MPIATIAIVAIAVLAYGTVSGRLETSPITGPIVFVTLGLALSPQVSGLVTVEPESELVKFLAEVTLALVLFVDASRIHLSALRGGLRLPVRMLGIGLPLAIAIGTVAALLAFPELRFGEAAVLATLLAPTDAALGQAVVSNPRVPARIRQTLNVESGLNDGICLPILLIFISIAGLEEGSESLGFWINFSARQLLLGPLVGLAVGYIGGFVMQQSEQRRWITESFLDLSVLGLSLLAYAAAELVGGNGFIATFVAGLTLGNTARSICQCLYEFGEAEGQLLILLTFGTFGAVMVLPVLPDASWNYWLYALSSLTVIRIAAVALSLWGTGAMFDTVLYLGWFGPRGVASIIYGLIVLEEPLQGSETIYGVMAVTVLLSVFAHGLTAYPGACWYADRLERDRDRHGDMMEHELVRELPTRQRWGALGPRKPHSHDH